MINKSERRRLLGAGVRNFFRIAKRWQLTEQEQAGLLGVSVSFVRKLRRLDKVAHILGEDKRSGKSRMISGSQREKLLSRIPDFSLERASSVIWVGRALRKSAPDDWMGRILIKQPRSYPFKGESALDFMIRGSKDDFDKVYGVVSTGFW